MVIYVGPSTGSARAQDSYQDPSDPASQTASQGNSALVAVPNHPTFSTTAEAVQKSVFEIGFGLEAADGCQDLNGLFKFGLLGKLELCFGNIPIERDSGVAGLGDSSAGLKFRFIREKGALPKISTLYTATVPSATTGLGAGAVRHSAGILVSKDFGKHHLDFNESVQWLGRQDISALEID